MRIRVIGLSVCAVLFVSLLPSAGAVSAARAASATAATNWLLSKQLPNGAFFSSTQRADNTADVLVAAVAGGAKGSPVASALDYISANGSAAASRAAFTGRIVAGIVAGGMDPHSFGGIDYVARLNSQYDQVTGAFEPGDFDFFSNVIAANGAIAGSNSLPPQALAYIRSNECPGGGFSFAKACAFGPDLDTTAFTVNVLIAAGLSSDEVIVRARTFALSRQADDGGFTFDGFSTTSGDSTGLGLSLLAALGEDAEQAPWLQPDGDSPVAALIALQDSAGAFKFSSSDAEGNSLSTINAVVGMAGRSYPIRGEPTVPAEPTPDPSGDPTTPGTPPDTILVGDLKQSKDRTPTFQFAANKVAVRFECSVDGVDPIPCSSPFTTPRLKKGTHSFSVVAIDDAGNRDPSPAIDSFKVKQVRRRGR